MQIRRNPDVMWRVEQEALEEAVNGLATGADVEDIGTGILFSGGTLLSVNYLGMEIWKLCNGLSPDEIITELLQQVDVDEDLLRRDVQEFLDELARKGFISYA